MSLNILRLTLRQVSVLLCCAIELSSTALSEEVEVADSATLRRAIRKATPGTTIKLLPGTYAGELHFGQVIGTSESPITICAAFPEVPPVIRGGGEGFKFRSPAHLVIDNIHFELQRGNGINIDDGGDKSKPARHVTLRNLHVRNIGSTGNHDGLKLSGVTDFVIEDCIIDDWGREGQAIDLIGCHRGIVQNCTFDGRDTVKTGLQIKGGSRHIKIQHCAFRGITDRALQIGGKTGRNFFRPRLEGFEATDILATGCSFFRSEAPIAFVSSDGCAVRNCLLYEPQGWICRILQESTGPDFVPCRKGVFENNIIVWNRNDLTTFVDTGQGTNPETFQFIGNCWFCADRPGSSQPRGLPSAEVRGVYGMDPQVIQSPTGELRTSRNVRELQAAYVTHQRRLRARYRFGAGIGILTLVVLGLFARQYGDRMPSLGFGSGFDAHSATVVGRRQLPPPQRLHFGVALFVLSGVIVAGTLWGFDASSWTIAESWNRFIEHPWGTDPFRRSEWVAALVVFVPVGVIVYAFATLDRKSLASKAGAFICVLVACAALATSLELLQGSVQNAVVSRNDVLAQMAGLCVGMFAFYCIGQSTVDWIRKWTSNWRPAQPVDWLLITYLLLFVLYSISPFNFIVHPRDLYHKFNGGMVDIVPFTGPGATPSRLALYAFLFVPVGAFTSIVGTSGSNPVRSVKASMLAAIVVATTIEFLQLFVASRSVEATQIVVGTLGAGLGAFLMRHWAFYNAILSPMPTSNRTLLRLRWAISGTGVACILGALYLAWRAG